jgi:hypothetical protein
MKVGIIVFLIFSTVTIAQTKGDDHFLKNITCKTCHICDVPTTQNPCQRPCPREEMITVHQTAEEGPDVIKIDKLVSKYQPVTFSHKVHAQMSEMSGGCANCHHYNISGPILPCSDCHSVERKREDISKPDLQAAYHRQCINCHKEWSHSTNCTSCHLEKGTTGKNMSSEVLTKENHPEVKEPEKLIYETNYNKGKIVTFYHNDHIHLYGADCVTCHKNDNCTRCHDVNNVKTITFGIPEKITKSATEHHQPCFKCHAGDECSKCHQVKPTGPFNHKISTGWELNRFHEKLECAKCHGSAKKFIKPNKNCTSCHKDFTANAFKHEKTGLKLDEIHTELDCFDCHLEGDFSKKPSCENCHDDKNFPKDKPGKLVN